MDEVEVKVLDVDRNALVKKLLSLGAKNILKEKYTLFLLIILTIQLKKQKRL